jgi:hypothetical protein
LHATQAHHAEEVLDVVLPADNQPTKVMQPNKESFHRQPLRYRRNERPSCVGSRRSPRWGAVTLDAIVLGQISIQAVTIAGFVADQSWGKGIEEAVPEEAFDELALMRRSAFDTNGERKTVIIGESDDFRSFATLGGPDRKRPLFCLSRIPLPPRH